MWVGSHFEIAIKLEPSAAGRIGLDRIGEAGFAVAGNRGEIWLELAGIAVGGGIEPGGGRVAVVIIVIIFKCYLKAVEVSFDFGIITLVTLPREGDENSDGEDS